jgi:type III secretory pathway component EscV
MNEPEDETNKLTANGTPQPRIEYTHRREAHRAEAERHMQRFRKFGILRLASVVLGLVLAWLVLKGLVTTHDLALAHIAEELATRAANVHFEDHLEGGQMSFDYQLRSGVVQRSNALELMRSVGLEV